MRVFIGLTEVAGYYGNLKKGFERLGIEVFFADTFGTQYAYSGSNDTALVKYARITRNRKAGTPRSNLIGRCWWWSLHLSCIILLFTWSAMRYDVFIFSFATTFLKYYELPVLRFLGKKIVYVFIGSDSRPPYLDGYVSKNLCPRDVINLTRKRKSIISRIERFADKIICTPAHTHLHKVPVIRYQVVGVPMRVECADANESMECDKVPRILHAPSDPDGKGTSRIRSAIENLRKKGYEFEYVEMTGKPNVEIINELKRCAFLVDQLYYDMAVGLLAAEAAFLGKPAIVGVHSDEIWKMFPEGTLPPTYFCRNEDIEVAIEKFIVDKSAREEMGRAARKFVMDNWIPERVAERYLRVLRNEYPSSWVFYPESLQYIHGCGFDSTRLRNLLKEILRIGGSRALLISDKPGLEAKLVRFATDA